MAGALPVVWEEIWGEHRSDHNYIEWSVQSEFDLDYYDIEVSVFDSKSFSPINKVLPKEQSSGKLIYSFEDYDLQGAGIYYYRIKQVDLNGDFSYSKIVAISVSNFEDGEDYTINMYPNPVVNELTVESIFKYSVSSMKGDIYDDTGRLVVRDILDIKNINLNKKQQHKLDVSELNQGLYTLKLQIDDHIIVKNFIVLNK